MDYDSIALPCQEYYAFEGYSSSSDEGLVDLDKQVEVKVPAANQPPPLIRTLSTHHWDCAKTEMAKSRVKYIYAGSSRNFHYTWIYYITRATTKTRDIVCHSDWVVNDEVCGQHEHKDRLPIATRCEHRIKDGSRRCKRKCFERYCAGHLKEIMAAVTTRPCSYIC
jgi:hypothetical protein